MFFNAYFLNHCHCLLLFSFLSFFFCTFFWRPGFSRLWIEIRFAMCRWDQTFCLSNQSLFFSLKPGSIFFSMKCMPVSKQINISRGGFCEENQSMKGCRSCLEEKVNSEVERPTQFNAVFTL